MSIDLIQYRSSIGIHASSIHGQSASTSKHHTYHRSSNNSLNSISLALVFSNYLLFILPLVYLCLALISIYNGFILLFYILILVKPFRLIVCTYYQVRSWLPLTPLFSIYLGAFLFCYIPNFTKLSYELLIILANASDFSIKSFLLIFVSFFQWKLAQGNDVESNPGPLDYDNSYFRVLYVNIRSLTSHPLKMHELLHIVDLTKPAVIGIGETFLDPSVDPKKLKIVGYSEPIRKDRNRGGGGVMAYIRNDLAYRRLEAECEQPNDESLWFQISHLPSKNKSVVGIYYRTPSMNDHAELTSWLIKFQRSIDSAKALKPRTLSIIGDLNAKNRTWYPEGINNIAGVKLLELLSRNGLCQLIDEPTRITDTKSLIDLYITDSPTMVLNTEVFPKLHNCDHCPIFITLNLSMPPSKKLTRIHYEYHKINVDAVREAFSNAPFDVTLDTFDDLDESYEAWLSLFKNLIKDTFPSKMVTIDRRNKPWFNKELTYLRNKMRNLRKKLTKIKNPLLKQAAQLLYDKARDFYHDRITEISSDYELNLAEKLMHGKMKDKHFWRIAKSLLNKPAENSVPPLKHGDSQVSSLSDKANLLNTFFCEQSSMDDSTLNLPIINDNNLPNLIFNPISTSEVLKLLKTLDPNKATGPDGIPAKILILTADYIAPSLTKFYNKCLIRGYFPSSFRRAHVIPIFKKGDRQLKNNYRPIALTNHIAKILEKLVYSRLYSHLNDLNFLSPNQSGFRKNDSTVNQLIKLVHEISTSLDDYHETKAVYLDISKAFDKVWHRGLLLKLDKLCGVQGTTLNFFKSYLSNRSQKVLMDGEFSDWGSTNAGVPQGSILGPLLFLIFINDVTESITSSVSLFADDTSLSTSFTSGADAQNTLQLDLQTIIEWGKRWAVTFNPIKTISVLFSHKDVKSTFPLEFGDVTVEDSPSHKHLGLTLTSKLSWTEQVLSNVAKVEKRLPLFSALKHKLPSSVLLTMYTYFIRPLLEYADVIWDNITIQQSDMLDQLQYQALLVVSGCTQGTNYNKIRRIYGVELLSFRRKLHRLSLFHKIVHDKNVPAYLKELTLDGRNLRRSARLRTLEPPDPSHVFHQNSFVPKTHSDWNKLPNHFRSIVSLKTFKEKYSSQEGIGIKYDLPTIQPRSREILLNKFRCDFTDLNEDKARHGYLIDKKCRCGRENETHYHYFFKCQQYNQIRLEMHNSLEPILKKPISELLKRKVVATKILVSGNDEVWIDASHHKELFTIVSNYIANTRRFQ